MKNITYQFIWRFGSGLGSRTMTGVAVASGWDPGLENGAKSCEVGLPEGGDQPLSETDIYQVGRRRPVLIVCPPALVADGLHRAFE